MQKQQVFKVKGMQRDASMANANGEFAYEILNMRLMPAEDLSGFSLTNEKGATQVITGIKGQIIGQCPTNDSLVVFTTNATYNENDERTGGLDYIYEIYQTSTDDWDKDLLYKGNLNFHADKHIESLFNYETADIQKVYWIDGINQLRCINLKGQFLREESDNQFDSVKELKSLPEVEISKSVGGNFVAGVLQYYITYFNEFSTESPIVYTSPLLYIANDNRGADVNTSVNTAYTITISDLDIENWKYIRIYTTHRTSLGATPEGSIIQEFKIPDNGIITFTDFGTNRTSINPSDLYFKGSKFVKAGTMTVKDQVMFLGNLSFSPLALKFNEIKTFFDQCRTEKQIDALFSTSTTKKKENKLSNYEESYYYHKSNLNNIDSISHYKYGEKYRFGISLMDTYGNWSNPIWLKDDVIKISPNQISSNVLELPCPTLNLSGTIDGSSLSLADFLISKGAICIKPLVVFPNDDERKIITQGVVCPTIYSLQDRKDNAPYAQSSWFMRPNVPGDIWGFPNSIKLHNSSNDEECVVKHKSDIIDAAESAFNSSNLTLISTHTSNPGLNSDIGFFIFDKENGDLLSYGGKYIYVGSLAYFPTKLWSKSQNINNILPENCTMEAFNQYILVSESSDSISYHVTYSGEAVNGTIEGEQFYYASGDGLNDLMQKTYTLLQNVLSNFKSKGTYGVVDTALIEGSKIQYKINYNDDNISDFAKTRASLLIDEVPFPASENDWSFGDNFLPYAIRRITKDLESDYTYTIGDVENTISTTNGSLGKYITDKGSWVEFRHNYSLRSKGSTYGEGICSQPFIYEGVDMVANSYNFGHARSAELDTSRAETSMLVNKVSQDGTYLNFDVDTQLNSGKSAIYVDSSIVTLNSPELEILDEFNNTNLENTSFRIIGMIPITASVSDISLEEKSAGQSVTAFPNSAYEKIRTKGLNKNRVINKNIGYHGYRFTVASNLYYSAREDLGLYNLLYPWHCTGSITEFRVDDPNKPLHGTYSKKVQSVLHYSASTLYFTEDTNKSITKENRCINNGFAFGWKPASGSSIGYWNADNESLVRLRFNNKYIQYYGNCKPSVLTLNTSNQNIKNRYFHLYGQVASGEDYTIIQGDSVTGDMRSNSTFSDGKFYRNGSEGSSMAYKSSSHAVIAFNPYYLSNVKTIGDRVLAQEILPALNKCNLEGYNDTDTLNYWGKPYEKVLYEDRNMTALPHQASIDIRESAKYYLPGYNAVSNTDNDDVDKYPSNYGWLWLGEIYRTTDPTFGGDSQFALENNSWEIGGSTELILSSTGVVSPSINKDLVVTGFHYMDLPFSSPWGELSLENGKMSIQFDLENAGEYCDFDLTHSELVKIDSYIQDPTSVHDKVLTLTSFRKKSNQDGKIEIPELEVEFDTIKNPDNTYSLFLQFADLDLFYSLTLENIYYDEWPKCQNLQWTIGDTYYQRFDTLKTYAHDDSAQNSIIDITSFMVETRVNVDGRYDRNRGQESNLQMSPTNFNLINNVYSQRDNFFTYRILDDDVQSRTTFPNQITWSLTKTAGETIDAWMNVTLASILDLDGTKGKISALKNFNNDIIAFQEKGLSHIMFNSRAQIATSEAVPIQIANTGKVDGQQYLTTDVGCQDKWNIVTTPNGLYFVDYFNKSIYRFNGQLEDISTPNGFRSWCYENLNSTASIIGYYDVKNKEVMYYIGDTGFTLDNNTRPGWLGFSELTGAFSSFYTYPKARLANVQDQGLWLLSVGDDTDVYTHVYTHQTGNYNELLNTDKSFYGLTVIPRQDSNIVKTFNNVEFRADSYNGIILDDNNTFDTISAETEYQERTPDLLTYDKYRPSNLKKKFRTWRANIPRVNNGYNRFVNQWAKIGLWKMNPSTEKTILHDLSVWYSE